MAVEQKERELLMACAIAERLVDPDALRSVGESLVSQTALVRTYLDGILDHRNHLECLAREAGYTDADGLLPVEPETMARETWYYDQLVRPYLLTGYHEITVCGSMAANLLATVAQCRKHFVALHPDEEFVTASLPDEEIIV